MSKLWAVILIMFLAVLTIPASAQIPVPTPTMLPDYSIGAPISIPDGSVSLWKIAPNTIQFWNMSNRQNTMTFLQIVIFLLIVATGLMAVYRVIAKAANDA